MAAKKVHSAKRREKPYLEQTGGVGRGRTFELSREILSIGRSEENEIVLKNESVSRCHAYLKKSAQGIWLLQDNLSKNGVFVNGKKVTEAELKTNDLVSVGDFSFRFYEPLSSEFTQSVRVRPPRLVDKKPVGEGKPERRLKKSRVESPPVWVLFFEDYAWAFGLIAGLAIGAGVWFKASQGDPRGSFHGRNVEIETPAETLPPPAPVVAPSSLPKAEVPVEKRVAKSDLVLAPNPAKRTKSDIRDLKVYLQEGRDYLRGGDKESAVVAFRFALVLDPNNKEAKRGLRLAGVRKEEVEPNSPPSAPAREERKPSLESRKAKVGNLLKSAVEAYNRRSYQEAIEKAEGARKIELPGSTEYLNEAKQIIDRAKVKQKEDFEPFVQAAMKKLGEKDFKASAGLCEEMLRIDPAYAPAKDCLARSLEGMAGRGGP
jgi:tetratricopeptide (TPR) repeat protein